MLPKTTEEKDVVVSAIEKFFSAKYNDGDIIQMSWIHRALEIKDPRTISDVKASQFDLLQKMEMFKSILLEKHNIALKNIRGEGYMVVPPKDQARYAAAEGIRAFNKGMKRTESLLDNIRIDALSSDEKRKHVDAQVKFSAIKGILNKQKKDVFRLFSSPTMIGE